MAYHVRYLCIRFYNKIQHNIPNDWTDRMGVKLKSNHKTFNGNFFCLNLTVSVLIYTLCVYFLNYIVGKKEWFGIMYMIYWRSESLWDEFLSSYYLIRDQFKHNLAAIFFVQVLLE